MLAACVAGLSLCMPMAGQAPAAQPPTSPDSALLNTVSGENPAPQEGEEHTTAQSADSPAGAAEHGGNPGPPATKRDKREAENAYIEGAKKLEHDDAVGAEKEFKRAAELNPANGSYAMAAMVARQRRITELVRQVSQARQAGDEKKAQALLTEARAIDPQNPLILEHAEPTMSMLSSSAPQAQKHTDRVNTSAGPLSPEDADEAWRIVPNAAEPIKLTPTPGTQTFDLGGDSTDVIRRVFLAYGIHAVIDSTVVHKNLRFRMEGAAYSDAIHALSLMADIFLIPADETTVIVAKNDEGDRSRLERWVVETIYLSGVPTDQFNEINLLLKGIFERAKLYPEPSQDAIVVRAPEDQIAALNETVRGLLDPSGEIVVEVRLYEVDTTKTLNAGASIPTQFGIFNVDQAAAQLVSQNSSLVQQAIAQGLISSTASNFEIAAALIGSGLVQSSLLNSTIGVFGGGITQTGITETGSIGVNLGLNSSDSRTLDDTQLRVRDRETATFREGTRYPITTSTYVLGLSGASSALGSLGNATINGVSVSSLLSQSSASTTSIPQITYEDLGVTLDAKPTVEKSGRINLALDLKIEALAGGSINGIPVLNSREFKSNLTVAEGQSALLSSLVTESEMSAMSGLPGLSEIPGFQLPLTKNTEKQTMQLVVVVTPHVVRRRSNLVAGPVVPMPPQSEAQ